MPTSVPLLKRTKIICIDNKVKKLTSHTFLENDVTAMNNFGLSSIPAIFFSFSFSLFLLSYAFFPLPSLISLSFYLLLGPPHSQFTQVIFSFSSSYIDPYMPLLGSSLMSRLSGLVGCRLFFFYFLYV